MKKIKVRFEQDAALDCIEVTVCASEQDSEVTALMERISEQPARMLLLTGLDNTALCIDMDDIIFASVLNKMTQIVTERGSYTARQPLNVLEGRLDGSFIRVSRHELVNLNKVVKYDFTLDGTLRLEFADGMETWASRRCIPAIRRRLNGKEAQSR